MKRRIGPHGGRVCRKLGCSGEIVDRTDGSGYLISTCKGCDRHRRGLCLDCPATLDPAHPRRLRCSTCHHHHRRELENRSARHLYAERPSKKRRECTRYRKKNRVRLAAAAKAARDAERAKGPPTPIDRLYWREKTARWRANLLPEAHAHELNKKRDRRAAAKNSRTIEVAA